MQHGDTEPYISTKKEKIIVDKYLLIWIIKS
jgi:hypothetical protein